MAGEPRYTEPMNIMVTPDTKGYVFGLLERDPSLRSMGEAVRRLLDLGIEVDRVQEELRGAGKPTNALELVALEARRLGLRSAAGRRAAGPNPFVPAGGATPRPIPEVEGPWAEEVEKPCVAPERTTVAAEVPTGSLSRAQRRRLGIADPA